MKKIHLQKKEENKWTREIYVTNANKKGKEFYGKIRRDNGACDVNNIKIILIRSLMNIRRTERITKIYQIHISCVHSYNNATSTHKETQSQIHSSLARSEYIKISSYIRCYSEKQMAQLQIVESQNGMCNILESRYTT